MSTRAGIAQPVGDSWRGYYVHSEGYPNHTGRCIVEMARARGAQAVLEHAASAPQGWTRFPNEPSVFHEEPFILSPEQDGGIEWLYLVQPDSHIAVYRATGWGDTDLRRYTHLATIDPQHPAAIEDMLALVDVRTDADATLAGLEGQGQRAVGLLKTDRLRSWKELLATPLPGSTPSELSGLNVHPAVLWPSHRHDLVMSPDGVLYVVQAMVGTFEDEAYVEPTQEEIDEWMIGMMDDGPGDDE